MLRSTHAAVGRSVRDNVCRMRVAYATARKRHPYFRATCGQLSTQAWTHFWYMSGSLGHAAMQVPSVSPSHTAGGGGGLGEQASVQAATHGPKRMGSLGHPVMQSLSEPPVQPDGGGDDVGGGGGEATEQSFVFVQKLQRVETQPATPQHSSEAPWCSW